MKSPEMPPIPRTEEEETYLKRLVEETLYFIGESHENDGVLLSDTEIEDIFYGLCEDEIDQYHLSTREAIERVASKVRTAFLEESDPETRAEFEAVEQPQPPAQGKNQLSRLKLPDDASLTNHHVLQKEIKDDIPLAWEDLRPLSKEEREIQRLARTSNVKKVQEADPADWTQAMVTRSPYFLDTSDRLEN